MRLKIAFDPRQVAYESSLPNRREITLLLDSASGSAHFPVELRAEDDNGTLIKSGRTVLVGPKGGIGLSPP